MCSSSTSIPFISARLHPPSSIFPSVHLLVPLCFPLLSHCPLPSPSLSPLRLSVLSPLRLSVLSVSLPPSPLSLLPLSSLSLSSLSPPLRPLSPPLLWLPQTPSATLTRSKVLIPTSGRR